MRTLYRNAITVLSDPAGPVYEELKIVLAPLTLGELTAIWDALREPYQLSVAYQVRTARLDIDAPVTHGASDRADRRVGGLVVTAGGTEMVTALLARAQRRRLSRAR